MSLNIIFDAHEAAIYLCVSLLARLKEILQQR